MWNAESSKCEIKTFGEGEDGMQSGGVESEGRDEKCSLEIELTPSKRTCSKWVELEKNLTQLNEQWPSTTY